MTTPAKQLNAFLFTLAAQLRALPDVLPGASDVQALELQVVIAEAAKVVQQRLDSRTLNADLEDLTSARKVQR